MEDQSPDTNSPSHGSERSEPVRSRWTPKPEQILILESIFNSGMVNPSKDETVRIRKLLEKFGSVGDANVFYWFQNRRSRSRRRQRQMQANLAAGSSEQQRNNHHHHHQGQQQVLSGGAIQYDRTVAATNASMGFAPPSFHVGSSSSSSSYGVMGGDGFENLLSMSGQMGFEELVGQSSSAQEHLHYQTGNLNAGKIKGFITVFINGVPTEVPSGPLDMKAMFGEDADLVHSSGMLIPINEFGFLLQTLQHGESYFLVSRAS